MKRTVAASLTFALLLSSLAGLWSANFVSANPVGYLHLPAVQILSSGNVSSNCDFISRNGNVYTLTSNVTDFVVKIECSDIVFDGAGHTIDVRKDDYEIRNGHPLMYTDDGLNLLNVHNVTVENVTVYASHYRNIHLYRSNNCMIRNVVTGNICIVGNSNTITESTTGIIISSGSDNLITKNNITGISVWQWCYSNKFLKNNFYLNQYSDICSSCLWDDGSMGNYWSNYTTKYPNASELANSGKGDTPFFIERSRVSVHDVTDLKCIDSHPLMYPWGSPDLEILGPKNATCPQSYALNFTINKPAHWIGYGIDGEARGRIWKHYY